MCVSVCVCVTEIVPSTCFCMGDGCSASILSLWSVCVRVYHMIYNTQ
jgi:hypothetical protein